MIDKPAHLTDEASALLDAGAEARIHYILSKPWVHYPKAKQIIDLVQGLGRRPRTTRMPSIAVYGDSGMGKSMIVGQFKHDDPIFAVADRDRAQRKFAVVELSGGSGERPLYAQILSAFGAPHNPRATIVGLDVARKLEIELERPCVRNESDTKIEIVVGKVVYVPLTPFAPEPTGSSRSKWLPLNSIIALFPPAPHLANIAPTDPR